MKPYVGITGFKTREDVLEVEDIANELGFENFSHSLMFGYLVSDKRIRDRDSEGKQSSSLNDLPTIVRLTPRFGFPVLHYFTRGNEYAEEIQELFNFGRLYENGICRSVQLNNMDVLPTVEDVDRIIQSLPKLEVILQLPRKFLEELTPEQATRRVKEYEGLISYVLVDPSGGLGLDFNLEKCIDVMSAVDEALNIMVGVAGGFSGDNVRERIRDIQSRFSKPFCIDAQGKLRVKDDKRRMDYSSVKNYLEDARNAL